MSKTAAGLVILWTVTLLKSNALREEIPMACCVSDIVTKLSHHLFFDSDFGQLPLESPCALKALLESEEEAILK